MFIKIEDKNAPQVESSKHSGPKTTGQFSETSRAPVTTPRLKFLPQQFATPKSIFEARGLTLGQYARITSQFNIFPRVKFVTAWVVPGAIAALWVIPHSFWLIDTIINGVKEDE